MDQWRREHPDEQIPDGLILTRAWPAGPNDKRRGQVIFYQYRADRTRRTLRGIDEQVAKAEKAVAGKVPVKRNRFITLTGATKSVNRQLEAKARALAGLKGYVTNLPDVDAQLVIDAYHRLFHIERSLRMSRHDLRARPIYHHKRASIEAHPSVVFAALAASRWIEDRTGVPLASDPGQLAERRVGVHQVRAGGGDTLRQTLHELHVRGGHKLEVRHSAPLCQDSAKPSDRFPGPPSRQSTAQRAKRIVVAAEPMAGRAAMSLDYAGRLRTSTDARHDLQGKRRLLRHYILAAYMASRM